MSGSTINPLNVTSNTTTQRWTTSTPGSTTAGFLGTDDGRIILAFLILILLLLLAVPLIVYLVIRKFCVLKEENPDKADEQENNKETQTDVTGLELQEFYQRRKPFDMSKHVGKKLIEVEEPPRWHQINPTDWNDPWTSKYAGKETKYIEKAW